MSYRIQLTPTAAKELKKLSADIQARIFPKIEALSEIPRPLGIKALQGQKENFRLRLGTYRIIYQIDDENLLIRILKISHRRDVYRDL
jgi:mRNA interferase RelE/StbE